MSKVNVEELTEAQETLLIPLWARAVESQHPEPILHDDKAVELVESIDYDFDQFKRKRVSQLAFCARAKVFDQVVGAFLERRPRGTVVEIGAGLDTRFDRLDNGSVRWFDLDLPAAMQVRKTFFQEQERRSFLSSSVLQTEWLETVKATDPEDALFVAEGVFYFLTIDQLVGLFKTLAEQFPGSSILFDSESPTYVWYSNRRHPCHGSRILWSLRDIHEVESWDDRFHVEESIGFGDSPHWDQSLPRFSPIHRAARFLWPPIRNMFRVNLVQLG